MGTLGRVHYRTVFDDETHAPGRGNVGEQVAFDDRESGKLARASAHEVSKRA
jgi:hypothetical protein